MLRLRKTEFTFAGLMVACPHCNSYMFPATLEAHVKEYSNEQVKEMYAGFKQELQDYVAESKAAGETKISAYGRDVARLFQRARSEMIKRKMLKS